MNIKKCISLFFLSGLFLLMFSCSKKKDYNADNKFLAYYNTYYSAKKNFDEAFEIISQNYNSSEGPSTSAIKLLDNAIANAYIIEQKFHKTEYIDDAFYIIAKSTYAKGKISGAKHYFNKILNNYKDSPYYYESLIWIGFIDVDLENMSHLESVIKEPEENFD